MAKDRWLTGEGLTALLGGAAVATAGFFTGYLPNLATYGFMGPGLENSLADTGLINTSSFYGNMYGLDAVVNNLGPIFSLAGGIAVGAGHGKEGLIGLGLGALSSGLWQYTTAVASGLATNYAFTTAIGLVLSNLAFGVVLGVPLGWLAKKIYSKLKSKKE